MPCLPNWKEMNEQEFERFAQACRAESKTADNMRKITTDPMAFYEEKTRAKQKKKLSKFINREIRYLVLGYPWYVRFWHKVKSFFKIRRD